MITLIFDVDAQGTEPAARPVLVVYSNETGGRALAHGEFEIAAKTFGETQSRLPTDAGALETNRCVAYAMTRQFLAPRAACDASIKATQQAWITPWVSGKTYDTALAHSNRAVVQWLSGNTAAAEQDLLQAERLAPQADFVVRNLTALHQHMITAAASASGEGNSALAAQ